MKELSIDIETYSSEDLLKTGVYRYAEAPDFTILLFAYAFDDEDIQIVDLASGEALPEKITEALTNPKIIKTAYNANFERTCIAAYLKMPMPPEQWRNWDCRRHWPAWRRLWGCRNKRMQEGRR